MSKRFDVHRLSAEQLKEMNERAEVWEADYKAQMLRHRIVVSGIPLKYRDADLSQCPRTVRDWAEGIGTDEPPVGLLLQGDVGRGKTYAACAVLRHAIDTEAVQVCYFASFDDILLNIKATYDGQGTELDVLSRYMNTRLLAIDDLGKTRITDWSLPYLFDIIDRRGADGKTTIVTTQHDIAGLARYLGGGDTAKAIISRLSEYERVVVGGADRRRKK